MGVVTGLRPHQWIKNVLVFGPVVLGHAVGQSDVVIRAGLAFVACCLAGSGTYLVNDLLDVESDRQHSSKRARPFAAGDVPLEFGFALAPLFFLAALLVAHRAGSGVAAMLGAYVIASAGYSLWLKRVVAVDVVLLAGLYCLRLLIGAVATGIPLSPWAAAFSMFFFLSVALMKRYAEIFNLQDLQKTTAPGRGYRVPDMQAIMSLGTGSGMTAVLVVALYLSGSEVVRLYRHPQVLWLECVLVLLAITRLWILTSRGEMHEDPVMFAVKDPWTVVLVLFTGLVMILAL
jgi:4-hydroxybenzoate polyprenyltransferase